MQPQSDKTLIDRFLEWWRGLWGQSDGDRGPFTSETGRGPGVLTDRDAASSAEETAGSTVADAGRIGKEQVTGATGASSDEFATGGYTGEPTDRDAVDTAAAETGSKGNSAGVGLDPERAYSAFATDAGSDPSPDERAGAADASGTTVGDLGVSDAGDLDAGELGSLEELEGVGAEFDGDARVTSADHRVGEETDSLRDRLEREPSDYTTSAAQDQGMRTIDEDDPGITMGQETASDFGAESPLDLGIDSGTDVESLDADSLQEIEDEVTDYAVDGESAPGAEGPGDALDDAALSDAEFETPGVPDEFVGDAANLDLETSSGADATVAESTEELGATGELGASEFGALDAESDEDGEDEYAGLFGVSDIDTTDLSYLDDSDNNRFDFSDVSGDESATGEQDFSDQEVGSGVADDIAASPTGVMDTEGAVASETSGEFLADASGVQSGDFDASGPSDEAGAAAVAGPEELVAASTRGESDGRTRGDDSGGCPTDFPIKGNASSKIYHLPDIPSYQGTKAAWCFASEADAIAAGYRAPGGHRNRAAGGSSQAGGAATAAASGDSTVASVSGDASSTGVEPESAAAPLVGQHTDDENWAATTDDGGDDDFGSGADDVESLQHQSPDDDVASEYADASPEGGEQLTAVAEVTAALDSQEEVDSHLTVDDATAASDSLYAGSVKGDGSKQCPAEYPIKGNAGSMIYHAPGRASYQATIPEWCFATAEDAENAGFRAPKR